MSNLINNIDKERFNVIYSRYQRFINNMNDPKKEVVRVFDPLPKKYREELQLIREVSKELQKKKDEDMKKAAAQAANEKLEEEVKEDDSEVSEQKS